MISLTEPTAFTEVFFFFSGKAGKKTIVLLCGLCALCERLKNDRILDQKNRHGWTLGRSPTHNIPPNPLLDIFSLS